MLFLLFQVGKDRYALEAARVVEVLPLVELKRIPQAIQGVAGLFNYRGAPTPVIDLSDLMLHRPAQPRLSTRIILVRYPVNEGEARVLGLIAERAVETVRKEPADFVESGVAADGAPYLGPVARDERGLIQRVEWERLLPAEVRDVLFRQTMEETRPC